MLIGELATLSGLSKDGIRHYEDLGLISSSPKQAGSRRYRDYALDVLDTIIKIRSAQRLGFALKDIGPLIRAHDSNTISAEAALNILTERLSEIRARIDELRNTEAYIIEKMTQYENLPVEALAG